MTKTITARAALGAAALALALGASAEPARAQFTRQHEQFYMPAEHNWVFRRNYPGADRLFNAFDYGHAILYEKLYTRPGAPVSELEEREYDFITRRLLVSPPRMPLEEAAIEIQYVKLAPEAKLMFEWAHLLHRQMYDVLGDDRLSQEQKDAEIASLLRYYKTRPDLAFSSVPKNMELMEGQYYSTAFRDNYPKFNGLIWGYHWLQVGLYEPLVVGTTPEERQTGVTATVARFRQMLQDAPRNMPRLMPMTAAVAPRFAARYPEAAIIFDNLHGMHDVISDILASPRVPREKKREEILRAAERYRDDTSFVMTRAEWLQMSQSMGVQNMGGPVVGLLPGFPEPTVERGAVMASMPGMDHGAHGQASGGTPPQGTDHSAHAAQPTSAATPATDHSAHTAQPSSAAAPPSPALIAELHARLMADPVIRDRVAADPVLQRLVTEMQAAHGTDHGAMRNGAAASDSAQAIDFAVRLLSDPEVEARIHSDPRLHQLWSDPEVQRRLAELRRAQPAAPAADAHRH
ncbi:MAG: hypothetical protein AVDCRST_MAG89-5235 [uncultured Gemmatimonadetes bacterium]|uniref:Uncharacterized protein n=1 Tax=uncultured Gemmatimonadota bacterium TaxID=203437 RepID=A0A6J4N8S0_9BACT|nr:MAG: hypothetical protein AVDCRST_MAG89-5235 [uncultured Gemmatimonadota bacterium]